tara:strand:+ start:345 stop:539 length:195 start_codon:yes stop_codon:yes gene_type:complete
VLINQIEELIMILKNSPFYIQDKNLNDIDNLKNYPTQDELIIDQKDSNGKVKTVHHRRDLDSLG